MYLYACTYACMWVCADALFTQASICVCTQTDATRIDGCTCISRHPFGYIYICAWTSVYI